MGTSWCVKFCGTAVARPTVERVTREALNLVVSQMSLWEPNSAINRLNRHKIGEWLTIPEEFCAVVASALRISEATDGAFDPTLGSAVDIWGFGPTVRKSMLPMRHEVEGRLAQIGWKGLDFDPVQRRVRRMADFTIDLNGIAKGYAVDLVLDELRRHDIHHALVEIGGELAGAGIKPDGSPWWIDVEPRKKSQTRSGALPLRIALHKLAVATSGVERCFFHEGACFSHTLDPRTASPIAGQTISATVVHPSCMEADGYATAFMVMPAQAAMALADRLELAALVLTMDQAGERETMSAAMREMIA
jgi:thiamine biosynthesis lipoprotein